MFDDYDDLNSPSSNFFDRLSPSLRAAAYFAIPFIAVDFFNYLSTGAALIFSLPVLALMYSGCGALGAKYTAESNAGGSKVRAGVMAGLMLWAVSLAVNTVISLILGTISLGTTLLVGVPYICICGPFQLIGGGLMGALGGWLYGHFYVAADDDFCDEYE